MAAFFAVNRTRSRIKCGQALAGKCPSGARSRIALNSRIGGLESLGMLRQNAVHAALVVVATTVLAASASAACREDLVATAQNLQRTRAEVDAFAGKPPAVQCPAYRQHIAALTRVRGVFARCDLSAAKAKNAGQVTSEIATFSKQMRASCKS
jgi:hypothetical protein